jgi:hypothetical protein
MSPRVDVRTGEDTIGCVRSPKGSTSAGQFYSLRQTSLGCGLWYLRFHEGAHGFHELRIHLVREMEM